MTLSFRQDTVSESFAQNYGEARCMFHDACKLRDISVSSYAHALTGPDGMELAVDTAFIGPRDADNLVIVVSGTHGLEGLAGSGCQVWWLREAGPSDLPPNVALLFIHMLNPWGAAWDRRQTEDNVDLNRNFLDFSAPLPENRGYEALREAFHCRDRAGLSYERASAAVAEYARVHGQAALASAIFQGQYGDPRGLCYGGDQPTWSNRTFRRILQTYAAAASKIAVIDLHTGFGPYGHGMLINMSEPGSEALEIAQQWYGPNLTPIRAKLGQFPYDTRGDLCSAVERIVPATVVPVALEFGTFDVADLLRLQIDACWLHNNGDAEPETARNIRDNLRRFFYPATKDWFQQLCFRTHQVMDLAIRGLVSCS